MTIPKLPDETKVVIIGGGVAGTSIAYHLTQAGWTDVVLLEQNKLAGGTSWHAAGLVGRLRNTTTLSKINQSSADLYARLEKETGHSVGWKQVGSLIVAKSEDRLTQLRRNAAMAALMNVEVQMISAAAAVEKWPLLRGDDLLGAAWLPHDGKVIPGEVPLALAKAAIGRGARVMEGITVTGLEKRAGRISAVTTSAGTIRAEHVIIAGGMWARQLGLRCGINIPLHPVEHHYVVTEPLPGAFDELPVGRDPDLCIYFRGEGNAVLLGAFQKYTQSWAVDRVPDDFSFKLLDPDWERYQEPLKAGRWRIPALERAKFAKFVNGPESFTPDNNFIMGETPEVKGLFVMAGFNSVGIASAGGAGKFLAEWVIEGQPTADLWSVDIRRFEPWANNRQFLRERVTEVLGLHYQMSWPNREFETGRNQRQSPLHARLSEAGAVFGAKNGWERPNWFALGGAAREVHYAFGRQNWFEAHAAEHRATRENVALFDQTGFGKLVLKGRDAVSILQRLAGNNVDVPPGRAVYTGLFNARGGFESDLTVLRLAEDEYYIVTGTAQRLRDFDWIRSQIQPDEHAELVDVTDGFSVLGLMGPRARALLSRVTSADLSNDAFPFGTAQQIDLGRATARAVRLTYVGELGWELHVSSEQALAVYETLMEAGKEFGLMNAGHYAINSLRLEKGYRAWGAELSPVDTPLEAGLGFAIDWKKTFLGREALWKQKAMGLQRRLVIVVLDDPGPVLWGNEPIYRQGKAIGYTTSGSYGHTLGAAVGMGYVNHPEGVDDQFLSSGDFAIDINGRHYPARTYRAAPYDPERKKVLR